MIVFGYTDCVFVAAHRLSLVVESRDYSLDVVHGLLITVAFPVVELRLKSARSQYLWSTGLTGMLNLLGPGIESVFPALAGGFLTTGAPGKS